MTIPHDHHFIPAFYLRQWCDHTGKLIEYTIKHGKLISKPVGPTATGYEFDRYAFPELPLDQSQVIEQKFFEYPDTFNEYLERCDPHTPVKARVNLIAKIFDNEIVGEHVNKMKRAVIDLSASPHCLLTSDRPVGLFSIKDAKGIITLPISPTMLFVAVNDQRILDYLGGRKPREIVGHVNTHLVTRARRFVWATDQLLGGTEGMPAKLPP